MIEFQNVTKNYGRKRAVRDTSFSVLKNGVTGLVGANGSGKSTMLKMAAGLIRPSSGKVTVNGKPVTRQSADDISYLSELDEYYRYQTVSQLLDLQESLFNDFNKEKARDILNFMEVEKEVKLKNLSKGNRGRVKIAITLARETPVVLMDEPLSGLDPMVRKSIVTGLISFIDLEYQALILTTHEISEIETLLDRVIVIKEGKIIGDQETETIRTQHQQGIVDWMTELYKAEEK
ncbi:ABC transporter ATP-binding protein [Thalassobacillus sp. C254]|uniref:ABC transporter ATP-binding protein n=1 Tax=Thalassobacillus sp. C254 TaxID=1225341 RepID=UPI0006CF2AE1|nr:ABC transporter ATP-binding protein [Thalassobacillus sp. C254]